MFAYETSHWSRNAELRAADASELNAMSTRDKIATKALKQPYASHQEVPLFLYMHRAE